MLGGDGLRERRVHGGRVRFVVGHKNRAFDCCRDGEGHGSVLCSYSNLTIARGAVVTLETTARHDSAEDFCRLKAPCCIAMGWIFIPAYCVAIPTG